METSAARVQSLDDEADAAGAGTASDRERAERAEAEVERLRKHVRTLEALLASHSAAEGRGSGGSCGSPTRLDRRRSDDRVLPNRPGALMRARTMVGMK